MRCSLGPSSWPAAEGGTLEPVWSSGVRRTRSTLVGVGLTATMLLAGCAEEEPEDFTADTRTAFLAACTEPLADSRLISAICGCIFEETQVQLSFERFEAIDSELVLDPEATLPDDIAGIVARCIIDEAEL